MEAKLLLQMDNFNNIDKARKNFKKSPKERITESYIQVRLESLEKLWSSFDTRHGVLIETYGDKLYEHEYLKSDVYNEAEELYIQHKTELKDVLNKFAQKSKVEPSDRSPSSSKNTQIELPKIIIPTFSGKYTEWITFRDLFLSLIHNNANLHSVQKMHYLKSYLSGEAEQLLRQVPISEANYERCWLQLKERYDNKRYLSHFILKRLLSQRNIATESASSLKELMDTTNDCLSGLTNLGIDVKNWDIIIIHILTLKLDPESRKQWEFSVTNNTKSEELPTYDQFKDFLTNRYKALEFLDSKSMSHQRQNNHYNGNQSNNVHKIKTLHVAKLQCPFCSDTHKLNMCKKFAKEPVDQRRNFVQTNNVCFNCLGNYHGAKACQSNVKCKLCSRRHHTLLHPRGTDNSETRSVRVQPEHKIVPFIEAGPSHEAGPSKEAGCNADNTSPLVSFFSTGKLSNQVLLATALVKIESRTGDHHILRALLDQGSQANFVTEAAVQSLKLQRIPIMGKISGVGGDKSVISNSMVILKLKSRLHSGVVITVNAYVLKTITSFLPSKRIAIVDWPELSQIELADPKYHQPNKVDLLLGADIYGQVIQDGIKRGPSNSLVAQSTSFGWILSGLVDSSVEKTEGVLAFHCQLQEEDDQLKKFWELESDTDLTKERIFTEEEKLCEEFFVSTTTRDEEGRYIVRLPFKGDDPDCKRGDSRLIAEKRLKELENRLKKKENENLQEKYKEVIDEYLGLNHMIEVVQPDEKRNESVYLPHHAVVRDDKDTTKVRVVFNASSRGRNGVSLNDDLMVGPTIQPELRHLIMRWRLNYICLAADIVKMYRQIKVHEDDVDFQRLLWRDTPNSEIKDYKLLRVTFGTACAPFLAVRALHQVAYDEGHNFPLATQRVIQDFYMDDLMSGCETVEEGMEIQQQTENLLKKGGFTLQKWTSNNDELLERIKGNTRKDIEGKDITKEGIDIKIDKLIKILGLTWERNADTFRYAVKLDDLEQPVTKRKVIADISRLFDPLGWITPCIIVAKALIQKLCISGIQWDEVVPNDILNEWCTYRAELQELIHIQIPRWVCTKSDDVQRELHGFCDASKIAYAAVVYLRVIDAQGNVHVSLITAKSKVAPIKQVSIPRLELCGAVLLSRLMLEVAEVLNIDRSELHCWTDSTIVLAWLNSLPSKWKVFVANRVSEILTSLNPQQWSHISTKMNPADCASRGVSPDNLKINTVWLNGPTFLKCDKIEYKKPEDTSTDLEAVNVHNVTVETDIWERFSTLTKLVRVVAYCRRFLRVRNKTIQTKKYTYLTTDELKEAMEICIRECQRGHFGEELKLIEDREEIKGKSALKTLNPFLDDRKILRVGGRLSESQLGARKKHPIVMPKKSHLTDLIIADAHRQTLHGGPQLMMNYISNKYFIIGAKQLVKAKVRKCVTCIKQVGATQTQLMGQLPSSRVTPSRPFSRSGVDFAGPFQIRTAIGRGHKSHKGYVCLFVCMSTRAVHVEAVTDLTTEGFLQAYKRFVARRGHCKEIWSDNGTNFVGAAGELNRLFSEERDSILPEIAQTLANNGTTWKFIPPHSPNFGGVWEAGIKSVKHHFKRIIGNSTLTYEEIATVLAQIEACLNSRPLSRLDSNPDNLEVLTPGHFLVGEALVTAPDRSYETSNISSLRRWQYTQRLLQDFWRRWSQEYLTQFFHRYRWSSQIPQPNVGDVVLIKEDGLPPCRWLYGLIIDKHPGRDGIARVVTVRTKNSNVKRPVSKLCILPTAE